jgi:hypothetical protein
MGDRLVAVATGRRGDVIVSTTDGQTWARATLPGSTLSTVINDLAVTREGLLAVGRDGVRGDWLARLWVSEDGEAWTSLEPPPDFILNRIVSTADPLAVSSAGWLWIMGGDGEWMRGTRLLDTDIRAGPGGFLWWDVRNTSEGPTGRRSFLMHSTDLVEWDDVDVSGSPRLAEAVNAGVIAHFTDDEWIFTGRRANRVRLPGCRPWRGQCAWPGHDDGATDQAEEVAGAAEEQQLEWAHGTGRVGRADGADPA